MHQDCHHLLEQVADLAFTNPFSPEWEASDCRLLGIAPGRLTPDERLTRLETRIAAAFRQLGGATGFQIGRYRGQRRETLTLAWVFLLYHRYRQRWFSHIVSQQAAGSRPLALDFAADLLRDFSSVGFSRREAARYIGLSFQAARAFFFIDASLHGDSPSIQRIRQHLWNAIFTANPRWYYRYLSERMEDFSTLLLGETGTGKSLVAGIIGRAGLIPFDPDKGCFAESFTTAFQAINLAQFPATLLESELFGHRKGAFTGAVADHSGVFGRCPRYGAVFIDEIGDIDTPIQVKLLNVIQDRTFTPLGGHRPQRFCGRLIAATHQDIHRLIAEGRFRSDLYYRLCSDVIELPPLRQRLREDPEELGRLIRQLLAKILASTDEQMADEIETTLRRQLPANYAWPGNIRELEQHIRQICIRGTCTLPPAPETTVTVKRYFDVGHPLQTVIRDYCRHLYACHGSLEAAARVAAIDRRTLKKYLG